MIVIADNSPLSALAEIGKLDLLHALYGKVLIPAAVWREACHPNAPEALRTWLASPPSWLERIPDPSEILPQTQPLGAGEAASITLAWSHRPRALLILDDKAARRLAQTLGLRITGAGGILVAAARLGLVDFERALGQLQQTSFRIGEEVVEELRRKWRETS